MNASLDFGAARVDARRIALCGSRSGISSGHRAISSSYCHLHSAIITRNLLGVDGDDTELIVLSQPLGKSHGAV